VGLAVSPLTFGEVGEDGSVGLACGVVKAELDDTEGIL